jgi:hypothetical protein
MGRRSSGGRHGGLKMLVSESARVRPDIVMLLSRRYGVVIGEVAGWMMPGFRRTSPIMILGEDAMTT